MCIALYVKVPQGFFLLLLSLFSSSACRAFCSLLGRPPPILFQAQSKMTGWWQKLTYQIQHFSNFTAADLILKNGIRPAKHLQSEHPTDNQLTAACCNAVTLFLAGFHAPKQSRFAHFYSKYTTLGGLSCQPRVLTQVLNLSIGMFITLRTTKGLPKCSLGLKRSQLSHVV